MTSIATPEDCYYFMTRVCAKGSSCPYRHCVAAKTSTVLCEDWNYGKCFNLNCPKIHSRQDPDYLQYPGVHPQLTQCYFETKPSGCTKPCCPYKHIKPRENNFKPAVPEPAPLVFTVGDSPMKDSPIKPTQSVIVHTAPSIKHSTEDTLEPQKIKKILFDKLVKVYQQPSTGAGASDGNKSLSTSQEPSDPQAPRVKTLQQIKREKILRARLQHEKRILEERKLREKQEREEHEKREALKQQALQLAAEIQAEKYGPETEDSQQSQTSDNDSGSSDPKKSSPRVSAIKHSNDDNAAKAVDRNIASGRNPKHTNVAKNTMSQDVNPRRGFPVTLLESMKPNARKRIQDRLGALGKSTKTAIVQPQKTVTADEKILQSPRKEALKNSPSTFSNNRIAENSSSKTPTAAFNVISSRISLGKTTAKSSIVLAKQSAAADKGSANSGVQTSPLKKRFARRSALLKLNSLKKRTPEVKQINGVTIIKPQLRKRQLYGNKSDSRINASAEPNATRKKVTLHESVKVSKSGNSIQDHQRRNQVSKTVIKTEFTAPMKSINHLTRPKPSPITLIKTSNKPSEPADEKPSPKLFNRKPVTFQPQNELTVHSGFMTRTAADKQKSSQLKRTITSENTASTQCKLLKSTKLSDNVSSTRSSLTKSSQKFSTNDRSNDSNLKNISGEPRQISNLRISRAKVLYKVRENTVSEKRKEIQPVKSDTEREKTRNTEVVSESAVSSSNDVKRSPGKPTIAPRKIRIKRTHISKFTTVIDKTAPSKIPRLDPRVPTVPKLQSPTVPEPEAKIQTVDKLDIEIPAVPKSEIPILRVDLEVRVEPVKAVKTNSSTMTAHNNKVIKTTEKALIQLADDSILDSPPCTKIELGKLHPELDIIKSETLLNCNASPSVLQMNRSLTRLTVEHKINHQLTDSEMNEILNLETESDSSYSASTSGIHGLEAELDNSYSGLKTGIPNSEGSTAIGLSDEDAIRAFEAILD